MAGWATGTGKSTIAAITALAAEKQGWGGTVFVTKKNDTNLIGQMITEFGRYGKGPDSLRRFSGKADKSEEEADEISEEAAEEADETEAPPPEQTEPPLQNGEIMIASYGSWRGLMKKPAATLIPRKRTGRSFTRTICGAWTPCWAAKIFKG